MSETATPAPCATPKARLVELLSHVRGNELLQLAGILGGRHAVIRAALVLANLPVPEEAAPAEFYFRLRHSGWYAVPLAEGPPQPGDLYVLTDEGRQVQEIGWVAKLPAPSQADAWRGHLPEWVQVLARVPDPGEVALERGRLFPSEESRGLDFLLRLPGH